MSRYLFIIVIEGRIAGITLTFSVSNEALELFGEAKAFVVIGS